MQRGVRWRDMKQISLDERHQPSCRYARRLAETMLCGIRKYLTGDLHGVRVRRRREGI